MTTKYSDWGVPKQSEELARFALASNSRVRAVNARRLLGWQPRGPALLQAIENNL
jgi:hypothetical protein